VNSIGRLRVFARLNDRGNIMIGFGLLVQGPMQRLLVSQLGQKNKVGGVVGVLALE